MATEGSSTAPCRLAGRIAVVTGASSGIGRAIALRLVAEGATVNAVGRDRFDSTSCWRPRSRQADLAG